jgi:hypothetical protein
MKTELFLGAGSLKQHSYLFWTEWFDFLSIMLCVVAMVDEI